MSTPWDESDFIQLAQLHFGNGFPSGSMLPHIEAFTKAAFEHYEDATVEGKAYFDNWLLKFYEFLSTKLQDPPDGADVRRMKRMVALGRKKHFEAKKFMDYFPTILHKEDPLVDEAVLVLSKTLQCLFDILHDATQDSQDGPAKIAILGLCYWLFDELTVAQYLARRNYSTLAYTHLRSVMEILDKIELFTQKPENAELWASGNEREIWKKLSPARVRELLGRNSLDPVYKYFSEEGSHSTFTAMRPRLRKQSDIPGDAPKIAIMIGGMKDPARQMSILIHCIRSSLHGGVLEPPEVFSESSDGTTPGDNPMHALMNPPQNETASHRFRYLVKLAFPLLAVLLILPFTAFAQAPAVGSQAPDLTLRTPSGRAVRMSHLLGNGPLVLIVLRG
jgi:hypothetical protein